MKLKWKTCFKLGVTVFILYLCMIYWSNAAGLLSAVVSALSPLILGLIIAYVVNILMSFYEKHYFKRSRRTFVHKSRRAVCMTASYVTLIAVVVLVLVLILPELTSCVQVLIAKLPDAMTEITEWAAGLGILPENIEETLQTVDWEKRIGQFMDFFVSGIGNVTDVVVSTLTSIVSGVVTFFIGLIFSFYVLASKEKLQRQAGSVLTHYLKRRWYEKLCCVLGILDDSFHRYIVGQCTEAVILGILCTIGMLILQLPYATMIGALTAFTALIPIAGAYIGAGVGAFMIMTESPVKALIFLIFLVILQQIEENLIYPKVVGSSMGLPAIWVLAAITVGGGVMGITGMLLGVPLAAALYRLIREDINGVREPVKPAEPVKKGEAIKADSEENEGE